MHTLWIHITLTAADYVRGADTSGFDVQALILHNAGGARASQTILNVIGDAIAIDTGIRIDDHVLDEQPATSTCTSNADVARGQR